MSTTVKLKRSNTSGSVPSVNDLAFGELALNTYDGKLFFKHQDGSGQQQLVTVFEDKETNFSISSSFIFLIILCVLLMLLYVFAIESLDNTNSPSSDL